MQRYRFSSRVFERIGTIPKSYPKPFKDRAARMVADRLEDEDALSQCAVMGEIAPKLGILPLKRCDVGSFKLRGEFNQGVATTD